MISKPSYWFKHISESNELICEPESIEFLKMWTGETFVHTGGTAFWDNDENCLNINSLNYSGVTHYRLVSLV